MNSDFFWHGIKSICTVFN